MKEKQNVGKRDDLFSIAAHALSGLKGKTAVPLPISKSLQESLTAGRTVVHSLLAHLLGSEGVW